MKLRLVAVCLLVLFVGCEPKPTQPITVISGEQSSPRYTVHRVGVISDDLAYNSRRGIYEIYDTKTGITYVGLSGVGIAELGSHTVSHGKTTAQHPDER